jgi:hypothetical protein
MHQFDRGGAQQQKMSRPLARGTPLVDDAAKSLEQGRGAVNLVYDDELPGLGSQEGIRFMQATLVNWAFKIQVEGTGLRLA